MTDHTTEPTSSQAPNEPSKSKFNLDELRILIYLILLALCIRSSIVAPYEVPTASMEPTIKVGDRIVANKLAYGFRLPFVGFEVLRWSQVKRGDIIIFRFPKKPVVDFVKRVVAVSGDTVQIIDDRLYINDTMVERSMDLEDRSILSDVSDNASVKNLYIETIDEQPFFVTQDTRRLLTVRNRHWPLSGIPYVVPEQSVFVMGDNRDNSSDSRKWQHVPLKNVKGRAEFVVWSSQKSPGLIPDLRWNRTFKSLYNQPP